MPTLFKMLKKRLNPPAPEKPEESKVYNPINLKVGGSVSIDTIDCRGKNFFVNEIDEHKVKMDGETHKFVDYVLVARPIDGDDVWVRLRLLPAQEGDLTHRVVLLSFYHEQAYDEGLHNLVKDESKVFICYDNGEETARYWRVNDVSLSYPSVVTHLKDEDKSGKVDKNEVTRTELEFWDFSRNTTIDGVEIEEFLFVEMSSENGWFQMWCGSEIAPEFVQAF